MTRYLRIGCPSCRRRLKVRLEYMKLQVFCNHCHQPFVAEPLDEDHADSPLRFPIDAPLLEASGRPLSPAILFHVEPTSQGTHTPDGESTGPAPAERRESQTQARPALGIEANDGRFPHFKAGVRAPHTEFDDLRTLVDALQAEAETCSSVAERLDREHPTAASEVARLTATLSRLEREVEHARAERDEARSAVEALRAELGRTRRQAEDEQRRLRAEAERLRSQVDALRPRQDAEPERSPEDGAPALSAASGSTERPPLEIDPLDSVDQQFLALKSQLWAIHQAERKHKAQAALIDRLNRIWRQTSPRD
jgi:hypothetical protein